MIYYFEHNEEKYMFWIGAYIFQNMGNCFQFRMMTPAVSPLYTALIINNKIMWQNIRFSNFLSSQNIKADWENIKTMISKQFIDYADKFIKNKAFI